MEEDLTYLRIANQVFGQPLLIRPEEAETIGAYVRSRMEGARPEANRFRGEEQVDERTFRWKGYRKEGNVGIVSVLGELVNRGAWMGASSGLTSYEGVLAQVQNAAADDEVRSILLDVNSPGGAALGMSDTARQIRVAARGKRLVAVVNAMAASAAYGLASAADEIVIAESGIAGSIGVVIVHYDQSRRLENLGVRATLIHAGRDKVAGHPYGPLSDRDRSILEAQVETVMQGFVQLVSDHRPTLDAAAIRAQEANVFFGADAVAAGLADRVGTFDGVLTELTRAPTGRSSSQSRRFSMSEKTGAPAAETVGISKAEHEAAVNSAEQRGREAGAKEATDRLIAALGAEGVKGDAARMAAALDLAQKSPSMSGADISSFVIANVGASKPKAEGEKPDPAAYEAERTAASGLAQPGKPGGQTSAGPGAWSEFRSKRSKTA